MVPTFAASLAREPNLSPHLTAEGELRGTPQQGVTGGILVLEGDFSLTPSVPSEQEQNWCVFKQEWR